MKFSYLAKLHHNHDFCFAANLLFLERLGHKEVQVDPMRPPTPQYPVDQFESWQSDNN